MLRYWEEELKLPIGRNEQGHRFYTEKDVELLGHVREWKQQGLQLKAIRLMLSEDGRLAVPQEVVRQVQSMVETGAEQPPATVTCGSPALHRGNTVGRAKCEKQQSSSFCWKNLVSRTVQESNEVILKELDFQFRQMEENAQEREKRGWSGKKRDTGSWMSLSASAADVKEDADEDCDRINAYKGNGGR